MATVTVGDFLTFRSFFDTTIPSNLVLVSGSDEEVVLSDGSIYLEFSGENLTFDENNLSNFADFFTGGTLQGMKVSGAFIPGSIPLVVVAVTDLNLAAVTAFDYMNGGGTVSGSDFADTFLSLDWTMSAERGAFNVPAPDATGNFEIYGGDGNDVIETGSGNDTIFGGIGDDLLATGAGDDVVYTGVGSDTVSTGAGDDFIFLDGEAMDQKVIDGGDDYDAAIIDAEFSGFTIIPGANGTFTLFDGVPVVPAGPNAEATAPSGASATFQNVEVVVFEDGLYSAASGFISTRTVQEDTNDDFDWNTIVTDFDIFTPGLVTETTEFDDGVIRVTETLSGLPASFTETDESDAYFWHSKEAVFDPAGVLASYSYTLDNGVNETTTYNPDGSFITVYTDTQDVKIWAAYAEFFNSDGVVIAKENLFDDGRFVQSTFENGVKTSQVTEDTMDVRAWTRFADTFSDNGVRTGRITEFDDGRVLTNAYDETGLLITSVLVDSADNEEWFQIVSDYDISGDVINRVTTFDDGTIEIETFAPLALA